MPAAWELRSACRRRTVSKSAGRAVSALLRVGFGEYIPSDIIRPGEIGMRWSVGEAACTFAGDGEMKLN